MPEIRREDALIKVPALMHLSRLGYEWLPRGGLRRDRETNILTESLGPALERVNGRPVPPETLDRLMERIRELLAAPDLGMGFHRMLTEGWEGWRLIDFDRPERNRFQMTSELACASREGRGFRPDITLFLNGLPLAMIEVKTREQARGIRGEYARMLERSRRSELRRFLQCAQVWAFSNDRENDPEALRPEEGAWYATVSRHTLPMHAFRERRPGTLPPLPPLDRQAGERILEDNGMRGTMTGRALRRLLSPGRPTHRMLTGLFQPERFLFLLRFGIRYEKERDENGAVRWDRRIFSCDRLFALLSLKDKAARGFRSWTLPACGASGEGAFRQAAADLIRSLRPDARLCWIGKAPAGSGDMKALRPGETEAFLRTPEEAGFRGRRIFFIPEDGADPGAAARIRRRLRAADPGAVLVTLKSGTVPEGGNYTYLLRCADGTLYCGWTNDLERRVAAHNAGRGARYTRGRGPVYLAYYEEFDTREEAMSREWHLKRMSRAGKERLIAGASGEKREKRK